MKEMIQSKLNQWYLPLISGVLFTMLGFWMSSTPLASYVTMAIFFAILFFISGIADTFHAIANRKDLDGWGWMFAFGILHVIFGAILVSSPELSMMVLATYIGFMMLFRAIGQIAIAMEMRNKGINS